MWQCHPEGSTEVAGEGSSTGVVVGALMVVVTLAGWTLPRSNSIRGGSQVGTSAAAAFQSGSS